MFDLQVILIFPLHSLLLVALAKLGGIQQSVKLIIQQIGYPFYRDVCRRIFGDRFNIERVMPLTDKNCYQPLSQNCFIADNCAACRPP